ncbi:MAG: UDP-N-acetyl glucosamine 2-epimerase, partial [Myxococcales bacterium]|nr:UDP-N-acetyl glucosamine 2-epimerase [Myxococcales bacterium]
MIHVEAGLRSFADDMPEETNRRVTDCLGDVLFVSDPAGNVNLANEGVSENRVSFVGNVMIDTLLAAKEKAMASKILEDLKLKEGGYGLVTLHRPSNVDEPEQLKHIIGVLDDIAKEDVPLVFPVGSCTRMYDSPRRRSRRYSSRWFREPTAAQCAQVATKSARGTTNSASVDSSLSLCGALRC